MLKNFTLEADNSRRYSKLNKPKIIIEEYIFGCEFEFYLYDNNDYETIKKELFEISDADLLTNEIRTMGGTNYHQNNEKIFLELEQFRNIFKVTLEKNTDEYNILEKFHLENIKNSTSEIQIEFMKMIELKVI